MSQDFLAEKRSAIKTLLKFYTGKTVPTVRITTDRGFLALELGKRSRLRDNSLVDSVDQKGWEINSPAIPIISGKNMELGYLTHPSGTTLSLKPEVKVQMVDQDGNQIEDKYIEASFEGTIGRLSDIDDFNQSIEFERSGSWVMPLIIGIVAGVFFFAPLFAWFMGFASGGH